MGSVQGHPQETDGHENGMPIILFRREIPLGPRAMETVTTQPVGQGGVVLPGWLWLGFGCGG